MRFEVRRTGWVDWNFDTSGDGLEVLIAPVLLLANLLVWLAHRARGRGYTLHVYGGPGRGHTRERFRTRAEAEAASAALQGSTAPTPAGAVGPPWRKRAWAGGDRVE